MKLTTIALFGAGYVLGTRAGRERYDQIVSLARGMADRIDEKTAPRDPRADFSDRLAQRLEESSTRHNGHIGLDSIGETLRQRA